MLTDTVGFVRHLPTQLVEAFRSTLEEVVDADLLVHVVDGSDSNPLAQIKAVRQVINEVIAESMPPAPELLVVNKIDAADGLTLAQLRRALPGAVFVSARTGDGLEQLLQRMAQLVAPTDTVVDVTIPYDRGDLVARVHADGRVDATEHSPEGTRIKARVPIALAASLRTFATFEVAVGEHVPGGDEHGVFDRDDAPSSGRAGCRSGGIWRRSRCSSTVSRQRRDAESAFEVTVARVGSWWT